MLSVLHFYTALYSPVENKVTIKSIACQERSVHHLGGKQEVRHGLDHVGIKLRPGTAMQFRKGNRWRTPLLIGSIHSHGQIGIHNRQDTCPKGNRLSLEAVGIALAIPPFMVRANHGSQGPQRRDMADDLCSDQRMRPYQVPLLLCQASGFLEHSIWDGHLADIMQATR